MSDRWLSIGAVMLLSACARGLAQEELPAVIENPTSESRAALGAAISAALNQPAVMLADDALTRDSVLVIERARARNAQGVPLSGRDLDKPEHFRLMKAGKRCILVHERTGKRQTLDSTNCRAQ